MSANPFTLTFGQKPVEFIDRTEQLRQIEDSFDMEFPTSRVYMIAGVRGSGKTVSLTELSDYYSAQEDWVVLNLSADTDLVGQSVSELKRLSQNRFPVAMADFPANVNVPAIPSIGFHVQKASSGLDQDSLLRNELDHLKKSGKKVLFIIDEISSNVVVQHFCSEFQIYIRLHYPVYLIMAGLYDNINNLQNEKTLTFLYRAPKIFLDPLNLAAVTASYQTVFKLSGKEAVDMARLTKGYPFAFQILGYLRWQNGGKMRGLLPRYDALLAQYAYEKIWMELSPKDQETVRVIAAGHHEVKDIREKLGVSPQYFNIYRKRLIERGVVSSPHHGYLEFALPRFEQYVQMYWSED